MTVSVSALLEESRSLGFLGPGPVEDHIRHSLAFIDAVPTEPSKALDLGAGGGLPGLVLVAEVWPTTSWTFLDSQAKRTAFLARSVEALGHSHRVEIVTDRAEVVGRDGVHRSSYDLVVSRSFGPPAVTAECAAPLLRPGGLLVVSEPPEPATDRWPKSGLAELGLIVDHADDRYGAHLMVLRRTDDPVEEYPRRTGIPAKRPLF